MGRDALEPTTPTAYALRSLGYYGDGGRGINDMEEELMFEGAHSTCSTLLALSQYMARNTMYFAHHGNRHYRA